MSTVGAVNNLGPRAISCFISGGTSMLNNKNIVLVSLAENAGVGLVDNDLKTVLYCTMALTKIGITSCQ